MPDEDGQKAWDVQRLIELSADLPVEEVQGRTTIAAKRFPVDPEPDYRNCHPADLDYSPTPPDSRR